MPVTHYSTVLGPNLPTRGRATLNARHINGVSFAIAVGIFCLVFFKLFEVRFPFKVGMLYISVGSSIMVHQINSKVIAFVCGSQ